MFKVCRPVDDTQIHNFLHVWTEGGDVKIMMGTYDLFSDYVSLVAYIEKLISCRAT